MFCSPGEEGVGIERLHYDIGQHLVTTRLWVESMSVVNQQPCLPAKGGHPLDGRHLILGFSRDAVVASFLS